MPQILDTSPKTKIVSLFLTPLSTSLGLKTIQKQSPATLAVYCNILVQGYFFLYFFEFSSPTDFPTKLITHQIVDTTPIFEVVYLCMYTSVFVYLYWTANSWCGDIRDSAVAGSRPKFSVNQPRFHSTVQVLH